MARTRGADSAGGLANSAGGNAGGCPVLDPQAQLAAAYFWALLGTWSGRPQADFLRRRPDIYHSQPEDHDDHQLRADSGAPSPRRGYNDELGAVRLHGSWHVAQHPWADLPDDNRIATLLAGVFCLILLRARSHPRTAVTVTTACSVATESMGYLPTPLRLAPLLVALYWLAVGTDSKVTRLYGLVSTATVVVTAVLARPSTDMLLLRTAGPVLWLLLPLIGGGKAPLRRDYLKSV
ncbi:hypothetical protein ACGFXB_39105 [Streptomyces canus]|uniref:hypothetical protein n=1 Tax=Streptomyces canus TaxID=58343 RepID=UPI00371F6535